jgi:hypothetical protein
MVSAIVIVGIKNLSAAKRLVGQFGGYPSERISMASGTRSSSRNSDKSAYIARMFSRMRNSRDRPINAPSAFIYPCQPIVANQPRMGRRCDMTRG